MAAALIDASDASTFDPGPCRPLTAHTDLMVDHYAPDHATHPRVGAPRDRPARACGGETAHPDLTEIGRGPGLTLVISKASTPMTPATRERPRTPTTARVEPAWRHRVGRSFPIGKLYFLRPYNNLCRFHSESLGREAATVGNAPRGRGVSTASSDHARWRGRSGRPSGHRYPESPAQPLSSYNRQTR